MKCVIVNFNVVLIILNIPEWRIKDRLLETEIIYLQLKNKIKIHKFGNRVNVLVMQLKFFT